MTPKHSCNTVVPASFWCILEQACRTDLCLGAGSHILGDKKPWWVGELNETSDEARRQSDRAEKNPSEDDFLLFPPRFLGYSTKEKIWGQFSVDQTSDVPGKQPSMFKKKLQLDERYKAMIQALVDEHEGRGGNNSGDRTQVKDIVEDKGKGLVLLLHGELNADPSSSIYATDVGKGPPGVGKTVGTPRPYIVRADYSRFYVLFSLQLRLSPKLLGSLSSSSASLKLVSMLPKRKRTWSRCSTLQANGRLSCLCTSDPVGLIDNGLFVDCGISDEADVFLEARTSNSDPNRNALVSGTVLR